MFLSRSRNHLRGGFSKLITISMEGFWTGSFFLETLDSASKRSLNRVSARSPRPIFLCFFWPILRTGEAEASVVG